MSPLLLVMHDVAKEVGIIRREVEFLKKRFPNATIEIANQTLSLHDRLGLIDQAAKDVNAHMDVYYKTVK